MNSFETLRTQDFGALEREARQLRAQAVADMIAGLRARLAARRSARRAPVTGKPHAA